MAGEHDSTNYNHRQRYLFETITCRRRGYSINTHGSSGADLQRNHRLAVSGWAFIIIKGSSNSNGSFQLSSSSPSRSFQRKFLRRRKLCGVRTTAPCSCMQLSTIQTSVRWNIPGFRRILLYSLVSNSFHLMKGDVDAHFSPLFPSQVVLRAKERFPNHVAFVIRHLAHWIPK